MQGGSRRGSQSQARARGKASGPQARPRAAQAGPLPDSGRLARLLEPVVHAMDMDLETVRVTRAGRHRILRVVVDADGGVGLDDIALASREFSARLDGDPAMGDEPYTLEVSSPGVDRPLTEPRHWRRAAGRLVTAPLISDGHQDGNGAGSVRGRIVAAADDGVTLERDGATSHYAYTELGPGRVEVEFGHFSDSADDDDLGEED